MPLLSEDLFRRFQGDIDGNSEAVSASYDTEIHPKDKTQHIIQETRPTEKLNDRGAANDKKEIQATISADVADGHNAQLDASLKLLSEDDPKLVLRNDLEDDEIHIIEATTTGPPSLNVKNGGNHALQDYQMQLLLLEQQNKKRLLNSRLGIGPMPLDEVAAAKEFKRRYRTVAMAQNQAGAGQYQQPSKGFHVSSTDTRCGSHDLNISGQLRSQVIEHLQRLTSFMRCRVGKEIGIQNYECVCRARK